MINHVSIIRHILIAQHSKKKVRKLFTWNWLMKRLNKPDPYLHTVLIRRRQHAADSDSGNWYRCSGSGMLIPNRTFPGFWQLIPV
jgi:hypothetical protein